MLLIDEPSIGLSPLVVQDVFDLLRKLADRAPPILMVEQNVKSALKMRRRGDRARIGPAACCTRPPTELLADPNIERLFLGGAAASASSASKASNGKAGAG